MYSIRHIHLPHHKLRKKDFLYFSLFFRTLVFVSFFTFIPAVIYEDTLYLGEKTAFFIILIFFFLYAFFNIVMIPLITFFYRHWGIRIGLVLSLILTVFLFFILDNRQYLFGGYVYGILSILWWGSYYSLFLLYQREDKLGKGIGKTEMFVILAGSLSHFVSGILLSFNSEYFFAYLGFLSLVSLILLRYASNRRINCNLGFFDVLKQVRRHPRMFLGFVGAGAEAMVFSVFWPLFLFLFFKDYISLGLFATGVAILAAVINFYLGRLMDMKRKKDELFEKLGVVSFVLSWIGKFSIRGFLSFVFFDIIHYLFQPFFVLPLTKTAFKQAKEEGIVRYVIFREFGYKIGNILAIILLGGLVLFAVSFETVFLFAAVFSLFPIFLRAEKKV